MTVPPHNGPTDPYGAPQGYPQGYPQQQPTYPSQQPPTHDQQGGYPQPGHGQQGGYPQHGYGQQGGYPQPGYGQMPPAPVGYGQPPQKRPGMITAAAVLAFIIGGIYVIGGLFAVFGSTVAGLSGLLTLIAILLLAVGGVLIWGGIAALNGKDARILTIAIGVGIVLNLISLLGNFEGRSLAGFVLPGLILYFLLNAQSKAWFDRVGAKHF